MVIIIQKGIPQLLKLSFQIFVVRGLSERKTLAVLNEFNKVLVKYYRFVVALENSIKRVIYQVIGPQLPD